MPGLYDIRNDWGHCSVDIDDEKVVVLGGYDTHDLVTEYAYLSDILAWDPEHSSWSQVGDMTVGRAGHAVTTVNYNVISQYCVGH